MKPSIDRVSDEPMLEIDAGKMARSHTEMACRGMVLALMEVPEHHSFELEV